MGLLDEGASVLNEDQEWGQALCALLRLHLLHRRGRLLELLLSYSGLLGDTATTIAERLGHVGGCLQAALMLVLLLEG